MRLCENIYLQKPTPPKPFKVFKQTLHYQLVNLKWELKIEPDFEIWPSKAAEAAFAKATCTKRLLRRFKIQLYF